MTSTQLSNLPVSGLDNMSLNPFKYSRCWLESMLPLKGSVDVVFGGQFALFVTTYCAIVAT